MLVCGRQEWLAYSAMLIESGMVRGVEVDTRGRWTSVALVAN